MRMSEGTLKSLPKNLNQELHSVLQTLLPLALAHLFSSHESAFICSRTATCSAEHMVITVPVLHMCTWTLRVNALYTQSVTWCGRNDSRTDNFIYPGGSALVLHEHKGWEGGRWVVHPQGEPISINIENFNLSHWKAKKGPPEKNIHQTVG